MLAMRSQQCIGIKKEVNLLHECPLMIQAMSHGLLQGAVDAEDQELVGHGNSFNQSRWPCDPSNLQDYKFVSMAND